jgi:hypothetical protein
MSGFGTHNLAMAVAHGITERTVATWHPSLPRDPRVLAPIQVDALVVRQTGAQWADTLMKRTPAGNEGSIVPAKDLLPKPFALRDKQRDRGVYLHWALPDALTRGSQASDGSTSFPAVPDRWLITRISPSATRPDRRAVRGWILQAHDDNPQPMDVDGWREPGKAPDGIKNPLTALGYGDISWAGFFDNTENRLAFYDDLQDVQRGPVAYLVCGWYSDPALDPLGSAAVHSLAQFDARMKELGWALPSGDLDESKAAATNHVVAAHALGLSVVSLQLNANINRFENAAALGGDGELFGFDPQSGTYSTDGSWWPQMTLLHGAVVGIGWPSIGWEGNPAGVWNPQAVDQDINDTTVTDPVGGPPNPSSVTVAIGNTVTEALARLVAVGQNRPDETRILEAFQLNALNVLNEADGAARVDSLLHANAFGSLPGGETTETIWQPPTSVNQPPPANPPQPDAGVFKRYQHSSVHLGGQGVLNSGVLAATESTVRTQPVRSTELLKATEIVSGNLTRIIDDHLVTPPVQPLPGQWIEVKRALPRFFHPTDPILLVQGGKASFKYKPGSFSRDGLLYCRLTGDSTTQLLCREPTPGIVITGQRASVQGADLLERGVENGSVPPECDDLLRELALLDPGTALAAAHAAAGNNPSSSSLQALANNFMVEQTAWHAIRDPRVDHGPLISQSGLAGRLPSPIAISLPGRPWNPIRLDWSIDYLPSLDALSDWELDEIDYSLKNFSAGSPISFQNSCVLTQGANNIVASAIRNALQQAASAGGSGITQPGKLLQYFSAIAAKAIASFKEMKLSPAAANDGQTGIPSVDRLPLDDIASALSDIDVLTGGLDGFVTFLRGGYPSDGVSQPGANDSPPDPFFPLRAGFIRITKLRLVDGFGQFIDLLQNPQMPGADPTAVIKSDPMIVPDHDDLALLPPRFTAPARLWFRFVDGAGSGRQANLNPQSGNTISPVCGYVMPNHLDAALEFFDVDGTNLGFVRPQDDQTIGWEEAPGQPSTVGQDPARAIPNGFSAGIAKALIQWGVADAGVSMETDNALQALLRVIDSALWAVDPYGHAGDEHLSLLVGHPVVVVRALLRLELQEPIQPDLANLTVIPVKLGALAHWQDGLFGYFVNDDYTSLHCSDAAAAGLARLVGPNQGFLQPINLVPQHYADFVADTGNSPVNHPYIDTSGILWIRPNQDVNLTLLVEPHTVVHATAGLLPQKEIGLRREWTADALAKLSPTFRFGPLLVDPKRIRMPIPTDIEGTWSWDYRADANTWAEAPVTNATQDALLPADPPSGTEGWLRLTPPPEQK